MGAFAVGVDENEDKVVVEPGPEDFGVGMGALKPDAAIPRIRHSETYPVRNLLADPTQAL
jgi:hypothetical protein